MFAQAKCLQLSNMHALDPETIKGLAECKVESLLCSLRAVSLAAQGRCELEFRQCGAELGVQVSQLI